jgi:uncharacterized membrane protein HdeD (DUF308 family)
MATAHTTPTPPQPRPGTDQPRPEGDRRDATPVGYGQRYDDGYGQRYDQDGGSALWGGKPWMPLYGAAVVTFVLGLLVLAWPGETLLVLALLFGCYLVLSGVLGLIEGLTGPETSGGMRFAYIVLGVLAVVLGLFSLRRIDVTVLLLAFLVSAFWIMRGVLDLSVALSAPGGTPGRGLRGFSGALGLLAGVVVLFWPGITLTVLLIFAGVWLIMYSVTLGFLGYHVHRLARQG